jgi:adenylate cyclase
LTTIVENSMPSIQIDLNEYKLLLHFKNKTPLTLHFNSPSRRFYLSLIALVVHEMKKSGKIKSIPLQERFHLLVLLNESIGGAAGSSNRVNLLHRIYTKWKDALPNLEEAPLFKVLGRNKEEADGAIGKIYSFADVEKDGWANLFEYSGSEENVRLKFAIDKIGGNLDDIAITYGGLRNEEAWESFLAGLQRGEEKPEVDMSALEEPGVQAPRAEESATPRPNRYRRVALAAVLLVLSGITWAAWKTYFKPAPLQVASIEKMAFPLPDVPSIAVLPFVNLSEDPKQEFLSDGISEEIITALSKVRHLFVISRQSTFSYKGKPVKVKQVSEDLGVRYVLGGSVQRSADRIRINVQLIDALDGHQLWAERYERNLKDLFALQDDITMKILTAIQVKLTVGEQASRAEKYFKGKKGLDCYMKYLEGIRALSVHSIDGTRVGRLCAAEAIEMCPENPIVYSLMSGVNYFEYWMGLGKSPRESIEKGMEMAQKALAMDDSTPQAHAYLGCFYILKKEHDKAIAEGERAVAIEPGSAVSYTSYGMSLNFGGRSEEAIPLLQKGIRLNPVGDANNFLQLGHAYRATGRFEKAVSEYKKALQRAPDNFFAHVGLTATYSMMGREQEARTEAAEVLRANPKFSVDTYAKKMTYKDQSINENYVDALRKAGLK